MRVNTQKPQANRKNTGKLALFAGVIVLALLTLVFSYFRSNASASGKESGEPKQMKPNVRSRRSPSGMGQQ